MTSDAIIECVPNFSEGKDKAKVAKIVASMQIEGVSLLDWSMDATHNRSVATIAGPPAAVIAAAVKSVGKAAELIDLTKQKGVHPRVGAADVVPFIPVRGISMAECAVLARQAGMLIWRTYGVPVYFYGAAAARPDRVQLEDVRRGQFEGICEATKRDSSRCPDIGGPGLHETAGASVVGARDFLIAYNVHLHQLDISAARAIARDIRASNGGLPGVKAMGVIANDRAQVSMNITDFRATPMPHIHSTIQHLAQRHGVLIDDAELIGLVPQEACAPDSEWTRHIPGFDPALKILERRLEHPLAWPAA